MSQSRRKLYGDLQRNRPNILPGDLRINMTAGLAEALGRLTNETSILTNANAADNENQFLTVNNNGELTRVDVIGEKGETGEKGQLGEGLHVDFTGELNENVITDVEGGSHDSDNLYIQIVTNDTRNLNQFPNEIAGDMSLHMIVYDGTVWYDFGQFTGEQGEKGQAPVQKLHI